MARITYLETGRSLVAAHGLWNSPLDGYRANPDAWVRVPEDIIAAVPSLMAGEWIDLPAETAPEFARLLRNRSYGWMKVTMPWLSERRILEILGEREVAA